MKILIISGFLGAGKTTFIKAMAKYSGKEFAILENEYGSVGIDGDILKNEMSVGDVNIWEMTEGCICCSAKGDFAASVLTIANAVDPEYLVIEPTGVGMLSKIIENLRQIEYEHISILAPVTIVDGRSYNRYIKEYSQLYCDQIAFADTVIISKMEYAKKEEKDFLRTELRKINPKGQIISEHYSTFNKDQWLSLLKKDYMGRNLYEKDEITDKLPDTFSMCGVSIESPEKLFLLLEELIRGKFGNIFRAKGQITAGKQIFRFDVSDGYYSITEGDLKSKEKIVFIGTEISRQKIRRYFLKKIKKDKYNKRITVKRGL